MTLPEQTDSLLEQAMASTRAALGMVSLTINDHHAEQGNVPYHLKEIEASLRSAAWRLRAAIESERS